MVQYSQEILERGRYMDLFDTMLKRRSIRTYTNEAISKETLDKILQAGLLAPTSRNLQPCEFIVVRQKETLQQLALCKKAGAGMLSNANCAIVVLGDANRSDVWIEDTSIAMTYMHLMATALGVGSCWVQCRLRDSFETSAEDYIRNLLNVPEQFGVLAILSLGMPQKEAMPHTLDELKLNKIHKEIF